MKSIKNKFVFVNDTTIITTNNIINNTNDNESIILIDYDSYINKIASSYKNISSTCAII